MATYSTDKDLVYLRPNILNNGQADFSWAHEKAYDKINEIIEADWYLNAALTHNIDPRDVAMDVSLLDANELKEISVYKALEYIYISMAKDIGPTRDGMFQWAAWAAEQYKDSMTRLLKVGPTYDWDDDGITQKDKFEPIIRRIVRC